MNEINLNLVTKEIKTQIRPIRFKWTPVLPDKIEMYYSLSVHVYYKNISLIIKLKKRVKNKL